MAGELKIRNYTSEVSADKSISLIEKLLVENGATHIAKRYDGFGSVESICFQRQQENGQLTFQLPANINKVYTLMLKNTTLRGSQRQRDERMKSIREQAKRTAWKNVYEWIDLQLLLIRMEQAEFAEVFLPYMLVAKDKTAFQALKDSGYKALTS